MRRSGRTRRGIRRRACSLSPLRYRLQRRSVGAKKGAAPRDQVALAHRGTVAIASGDSATTIQAVAIDRATAAFPRVEQTSSALAARRPSARRTAEQPLGGRAQLAGARGSLYDPNPRNPCRAPASRGRRALSCAASPALAGSRPPTIVRHEHVGRSGVYDVRIAIGHRLCCSQRRQGQDREALTGRHDGRSHRRASVRVELAVRGPMLTIRATANRGMPTLAVTLRRVARSPRPSHPPRRSQTLSSTGAGVSGGPVGVPGAGIRSLTTSSPARPSTPANGLPAGSAQGSPPPSTHRTRVLRPQPGHVANGELDLS